MAIRNRASLLLAASLSLAAATLANAGGFNRGTADTDILFEDGQFLMRGGATIVAPQRGYATITSPALLGGAKVNGTDGRFTETYEIPSFALKFDVSSDLRCAGTQTTPFGAALEYGPQAILIGAAADGTGTTREGFNTNEFAATCAYKFDMGRGRFWLIGGVYMEDFDYYQTVQFANFLPGVGGSRATLTFNGDDQPGYRVGAAYEIPDIALRGEVLYRSGINVRAGGQFSSVFDARTGGPVDATSRGSLPQSVELRMQSGIAPGWLAFGTVKWTDWSVLDTFDYNISTLPAPFSGDKALEFFWRDGWTFTAGLGHTFSKSVSGLVSLTYDRGVSTSEDALTDSYTLASGVSLKDKYGGELRLGGAISYLTAGSVDASTARGLGPGNSFAYTVGDDVSYAVSASYKVKW